MKPVYTARSQLYIVKRTDGKCWLNLITVRYSWIAVDVVHRVGRSCSLVHSFRFCSGFLLWLNNALLSDSGVGPFLVTVATFLRLSLW